MKHRPIIAFALFFDDVRFEVNNKTSWMGNYAQDLILLDPLRMPVDQLAVVAFVKWRYEEAPAEADIIVKLPHAEARQNVALGNAPPPPASEQSPFSGVGILLPQVFHLQPLAPGDVIEVWLEVETERYPLGRLLIRGQVSPPDPQEAPADAPSRLPGGRKRRRAAPGTAPTN